MATIIYKKKGREYAHWVRSARVNGKSRIVEQVYLGQKDRYLEEVRDGPDPRMDPDDPQLQ